MPPPERLECVRRAGHRLWSRRLPRLPSDSQGHRDDAAMVWLSPARLPDVVYGALAARALQIPGWQGGLAWRPVFQ